MGSICLLCTFARLRLWQHVARGALIIRLPLLAPGHSTSLHNHVNQRGQGQIHTDSLDVVVKWDKRETPPGKQRALLSFHFRGVRFSPLRC